MIESNCDTKPSTWYNNYKFPLIPLFTKREGNECNTPSYSFNWLFVKLWTLDSFDFEISLVITTHWGFGLIGILPYLRWVITIPFPYKLEKWIMDNLWKKPKKHGII